MDRSFISSTNLNSAGWEEGVMEVEFKNGQIYKYSNVPHETFLGLIGSITPGDYFNQNVKNKFSYSRS